MSFYSSLPSGYYSLLRRVDSIANFLPASKSLNHKQENFIPKLIGQPRPSSSDMDSTTTRGNRRRRFRLGSGRSPLLLQLLVTHVILAAQLLERLPLGLRDQEGGTDTEQHEEGIDLENVVHPGVGVAAWDSTAGAERGDGALADDGADLAHGSGQAVRGRSVAGGEDLAGDDEGGGVGAEIEEELGEHEDGEQSVRRKVLVGETHDHEEDGEDAEAHELNRLAAKDVDGEDGDPVAGDGTGEDDDHVADSGVVEDLVGVLGAGGGVADDFEDGGVVERDTIVGNIKEAPRESSTGEKHGVLALGVVTEEVSPAGLGDLHLLLGLLLGGDAGNLIGVALGLTLLKGFNVVTGLLNVTSNVEGVAGSLGDGQAVVEGDAAGDGTHANDGTPHLINGDGAVSGAGTQGRGSLEGLLETESDEKHDKGGSELTKTLHGKDGTHHGTSPLGCSKLGSNDRRKGIVSTDTDTLEI